MRIHHLRHPAKISNFSSNNSTLLTIYVHTSTLYYFWKYEHTFYLGQIRLSPLCHWCYSLPPTSRLPVSPCQLIQASLQLTALPNQLIPATNQLNIASRYQLITCARLSPPTFQPTPGFLTPPPPPPAVYPVNCTNVHCPAELVYSSQAQAATSAVILCTPT